MRFWRWCAKSAKPCYAKPSLLSPDESKKQFQVSSCRHLTFDTLMQITDVVYSVCPEETPPLYPEMLSPAQTQALLARFERRSHQNFENTEPYSDTIESADRTPYTPTAP